MQEKGCPGFVRHVIGFSFYFLAGFIKHLLLKTAFASYYLKLSLLEFLKYFLIYA